MSAGAYAGPRNCPNCNDPIPPGSGTECPNCRHPLTKDGKDNKEGKDEKDGKDEKSDPLAATRPNKPTETRDADDTLISSTPLVPAWLRRPPATSPEKKSTPPPTTEPPPPPPSKKAGFAVAMVAIALVFAVALGYVAYRVARPIVGPSVSGEVTAAPTTTAPSATSPPSPTPTPSPEPSSTPDPELNLKRIKSVTAEASSTLPPDNYTYDIVNTLDRESVTAWNSNGEVVGERAKGVTLTYRFSKPVDLREIEIYNGYQRSDETFINNGRVRRLLVTTDATEESFKLKDKQGKQTIASEFGLTDKVVLTIEDVFRDETTKYKDCALSEVTFFRV